MKISIDSLNGRRVEIIDLDTNKIITHCIEADDETGEYTVYMVPYWIDSSGEIRKIKKTGRIKINIID
jgi:hypothetical protein